MDFEEFDVVRLLPNFDATLHSEDIEPGEELRPGDSGTVVMVYGDHEAYEVEFLDEEGNTTALGTFFLQELESV